MPETPNSRYAFEFVKKGRRASETIRDAKIYPRPSGRPYDEGGGCFMWNIAAHPAKAGIPTIPNGLWVYGFPLSQG